MPFRNIAGHRRVLALLAGAATRGSLPPSLIFAGPEGVGKYTAALALAQLLNCERPVAVDENTAIGGPPGMFGEDRAKPGPPPGLDACGQCAACRRIGRGVHADVLVLAPGDTGSIK